MAPFPSLAAVLPDALHTFIIMIPVKVYRRGCVGVWV